MWLKELFWEILFSFGIPGPEQFEEIKKKSKAVDEHYSLRTMMGLIFIVLAVIFFCIFNAIGPFLLRN